MRGSHFLVILLFICSSILHVDCHSKNANAKFADVQLVYARDLDNLSPKDPIKSKLDTLDKLTDIIGECLNGTLIIAVHDTVLMEKAFGYLEIFKDPTGYGNVTYNDLAAMKQNESNKMTTYTLFDLASVSKQFTAAAILKLCSEEKLNLTDSLYQFYPDLPYKYVTIRQMLAHTSGIPEYFNFAFNIYDTTVFISNEQLIKVMEKQRYPYMFNRGSQFKYVNTNYAILAAIVAQVSGVSFEEYVRENLWKPAGMKDTRFFTEIVGVAPEDKLQHSPVEKGQEYVDVKPMKGTVELPVARGHWKNAALASYDRLNGILGDKGVYSNVEDMVRWTNAFYLQYKILPKEWVDKAIKCQNKLSNGKIPAEMYGYGVRMENKPGHDKVVYHGGLWDGFHNVWMYRPSDGLQIIFLSNYYNRGHIGRCDQLLEIIDN